MFSDLTMNGVGSMACSAQRRTSRDAFQLVGEGVSPCDVPVSGKNPLAHLVVEGHWPKACMPRLLRIFMTWKVRGMVRQSLSRSIMYFARCLGTPSRCQLICRIGLLMVSKARFDIPGGSVNLCASFLGVFKCIDDLNCGSFTTPTSSETVLSRRQYIMFFPYLDNPAYY